MRIELNHRLLAANTDPAGNRWHYERPWVRLQAIAVKRLNPLPSWPDMPSNYVNAGSVELQINCGGIRVRDVSKDDKEFFRWALENIRRVHPEIPPKPNGNLHLHIAENDLRKAEFDLVA